MISTPRLPVVLLACACAGTVHAARPAGAEPADFAAKQASWDRHQALERESLFRGLPWRNIGPVVQGGRVVAVEPVPGKPYSFWVAYASGGLWRTDNNGVTFEPVFDRQPAMIIGAIAVDPQRPDTIWVGTGENNSSRSSYGGWGVFRSDDAGKTWSHRGLGDTDRIGRILVDPQDSNRVLVGSIGKLYTRGGGRGVYRTRDGGKSWDLVLDTARDDGETGVIDLARDPSDPSVVYAAAWQRSRRPWNFVEGGAGSGIYKSTDAGETWKRLSGGLPAGAHVGRIGIAVAPSRPRTVYASIDNQELLPESDWDLGDGAVTAKRLRGMTKAEFLAHDPEAIEDFIRDNDFEPTLDAKELIRRVREDEVTLEQLVKRLDDANANLFRTDVRGLEVWRSDDAGATWRRTHDRPIRDVVYTYGYYFGQIRVAPDDPDRIYCVGVPLIVSDDGGKTFHGINGRDVHVDHHEVWVDPAFPNRLIAGNDGGLDVSYDGGKTWLKIDAQPVGQFYTVAVDMDEPYNVYGGLQDNGSLKGSSKSRPGIDEWQFIGGGDGMYVQIDPRDRTVYTGFQFGFYARRTPGAERGEVRPREALDQPPPRYNWSSPVLLSHHAPDVVYFGASKLYRSTDRGETWTAISDELARSSWRGDVPFATITTIAESPKSFGLLWAGTDDGYVWVSDDGGAEWVEATDGLPRDRWVTRVEASRAERARAYVSLSGYRDDDITPYLYVTEDLGRSWRSIAAGLPAEPINVVREDPVNHEVLWVGTDRGVYVSLDRGASWQAAQADLPNVPVHDLVVHPRDREVVAGTHGRSVYILDALPAQDLTAEVQAQPVHLFPVDEVKFERGWNSRRDPWFRVPEDEPRLEIPYWAASEGKATLTIEDGDGRRLRTLEADAVRGVNRFTWDLLLDARLAVEAEKARLESEAEEAESKDEKDKKKKSAEDDDEETDEAKAEEATRAKTPWAEALRLERPLYVTPGKYVVRVNAGGAESESKLEVKSPEPRRPRAKKKPPIRGKKDDGG